MTDSAHGTATGSSSPSAGSQAAGPKGAVASFFKNYAQFKGYSSRGEFWWPWLLLLLIHLGLGVITAIIVGTAFSDDIVTEAYDPAGQMQFSYQIWFEGTAGLIVTIAGVLHFGIWAATISPLLAVTWRRFHDAGMPGPLFFLWFIPLIGWIIVLILLALPSKPHKRRAEWDSPTTSG